MTKFDMSAAWNEAVRLMGANRDVLLVVAGVFFFLPYVVFTLLFTNQIKGIEAAQGARSDPDAMGQALMGFYGDIWWVFVIIIVMQGIGMIGLLALLSDRSRPTVGQALGIGAKMLLPYIGAQLIVSTLVGLLMLVPLVIGAGVSVAVGVIVGIAAIVGIMYLFAKFMLVPPILAIERVANPITAIARSWALTKGNSVRIFLFVAMIAVAIFVVGIIVSMVVGLVFALAGEESALIGQAIASGLMNATFVTVFLAVLAAIHRQLAGPSPERVSATFD